MKRIISDEQKRMNEVKHLYENQKKRIFDYSISDFYIKPISEETITFEAITFKWKHKNWKTWMKGAKGYAATQDIINKYIIECNKPYGTRNLSFIHLAES